MSTVVHTLIASLAGRIDQLSRRDRWALISGIVAAAIGIETLVLLPLHDRRAAVERSLQASAAQHVADRAAQQADLALRLGRARTDSTDVQARLTALGLGTGLGASAASADGAPTHPAEAPARESLSDFVHRSLRGQGVTLTTMRGLPVEPLVTAPTESGVAQPAATTPDAQTIGAELYRHRAELQIEGAIAPLMQAIDQLEHGLAPLRIERVRLAPAEPGGQTIQATLVLTTINTERTWLAL